MTSSPANIRFYVDRASPRMLYEQSKHDEHFYQMRYHTLDYSVFGFTYKLEFFYKFVFCFFRNLLLISSDKRLLVIENVVSDSYYQPSYTHHSLFTSSSHYVEDVHRFTLRYTMIIYQSRDFDHTKIGKFGAKKPFF
jgi:hypothetical protein